MTEHVAPSRLLHNLLIAVIIIAAMIFTKAWLIPVSWGFLFACFLYPLCSFLEKKGLNRTAVSMAVTLCFCIVMVFVLYFLITSAFHIIQNNDNVLNKIKEGFESAVLYIQSKTGIEFYHPENLKENISNAFRSGIGILTTQFSTVGANLLTIALTPVFLFFLLNARGLVKDFFLNNYSGNSLETIQNFIQKAHTSVKNYLWGTLILTVVTAIMTYIILILFGIKSAIFFSVFLAILNIIPYLGNLIAYIGILSFVWITKDSGSTVIYVTICLYFSNMIQENILRPKLIGDKMEINPFMILSAVMLGAIIWGVSGMVLFVPFLGIGKALVESNPEWNKYAILFSSGEGDKRNRMKNFASKILNKKEVPGKKKGSIEKKKD
ncbi:MAG: AI-2E family transporter [Cytophaga sp.]|uniref:AI-2E family transporter n=1 Tax=Cytophaga sp. TaxID=29535 RepID=UPI003F807003